MRERGDPHKGTEWGTDRVEEKNVGARDAGLNVAKVGLPPRKRAGR